MIFQISQFSKTKNFLDPYFRFKLFSSAKFDAKKFDEDKEKLLDYYNSIGHRDAQIVSDTMYGTQKGNVKVGGNDLENFSHKTWRKAIGVVMQESFIFNDSIAANIAVDGESIDTTRLKQAAITANILEFVESLPLGFNTKIGAEGVGVSAGQKQRILIARAVYKNPDYIFFDDPPIV